MSNRQNVIAYSGVVADLFHFGHLQSIQFARSISDYNVVGVITDDAVAQYRAKPIMHTEERAAIISNLKCVDRVMIQESRDPTENLKKLYEEFSNAKIILVHGSDLGYVHGSEYVKSIGGEVKQHPYYERLSTQKIINSIVENKDKFKDIVHLDAVVRGGVALDEEYRRGNKVIISGKADTLASLKPLLTKSRIEKMIFFPVSDWKNKKGTLTQKIKDEFGVGRIVVRSSATNEDTIEHSMAGYFESVLDVDPNHIDNIERAIERVIGSYDVKMSGNSFNQVLIQQQSEDVVMSGVVLTRSLERGSPYYIVNYDDVSNKTDTVTKGIAGKTIKISRFANREDVPFHVRGLLAAVQEIEGLIPDIGLDIEFAITNKSEIIIFQVRPLINARNSTVHDEEVKNKLASLQSAFEELSKSREHLVGERTIFADMSDWNPAEIIGDTPNFLDYSLYDYIITDSAWHEARSSQGYFSVRPAKLVVRFGNKPYVDVRASFNSFTPQSISTTIRKKLVDFYLEKLERKPELQDKVEFEVALTCYDFRFDHRTEELRAAVFTQKEIEMLRHALLDLTNNLVTTAPHRIIEDVSSTKSLGERRERIREQANNCSVQELLACAKTLLDDCRNRGTVQFSRLARLAFIGKIILKSLVHDTIISEDCYDSFMNSVNTVAKEMGRDFQLFVTGKMKKESFVQKYYHLRPCSYDITRLRYGSQPELLQNVGCLDNNPEIAAFLLNPNIEGRISEALRSNGLKFDASFLFTFVRSSLEARELAKFEFTKNVSDALEYIARAGDAMGFVRDELAELGIDELFVEGERDDLTRLWKEKIVQRRKENTINKLLILPPVLCSSKHFYIVDYYSPRPNYITNKRVEARLVNLNNINGNNMPDIQNKIVLIESGDPGYDWIFTRKIAGLITKYGGVASHMSIRCAEFGIPAAIGCGILFDTIATADSLVLDCKFKRIEFSKAALW